MFNYPARIAPDGDQFLATFRDIPEAITAGNSFEEAMDMALDALVTAMDFYFEDDRPVPLPSKLMDGEVSVELPTSTTAKVLLLNEMLAQKVKAAELARRLHVDRQEVLRITQLNHATKIDRLADAFKVLGKKLEINVI